MLASMSSGRPGGPYAHAHAGVGGGGVTVAGWQWLGLAMASGRGLSGKGIVRSGQNKTPSLATGGLGIDGLADWLRIGIGGLGLVTSLDLNEPQQLQSFRLVCTK